MKIEKNPKMYLLSLALLALLFSACGKAGSPVSNQSTANSNKGAGPAVVANANQPPANKQADLAKTTTAPAIEAAVSEIQGELQVGESESVILYVGRETGDYAAYCFANDAEAGRAILSACKDREQCQVKAAVDYSGGCKVKGLEADLSESGTIVKVESVKTRGRKK